MKGFKRASVDVILCCYNQDQYIVKALESVLSQKVNASVRVLVADDGSSDKTFEIIKSYETKSPFPFIYFDNNGNIGMQSNYKRAFEACKSDYTAILEGDDWWSSDSHLAKHIAFLKRHSRYSMSFNSITYYFQEDGTFKVNKWPYNRSHIAIKLCHQLGWGNQIGNLSSCVFRTKLLQALPDKFFKLQFADWELGVMMALKGPIAKLKDSTSVYRINNKGQWSALSTENRMVSEKDALKKLSLLLPSSCEGYINMYTDILDNKGQSPELATFKTRIRTIIRQIKEK